MYSSYKKNQKLQTKWNEYEFYESEPRTRKQYDMSPDLEDVLLDHGYLLKARVRRNMKKIRRQYVNRSDRTENNHNHWAHIYKHA
jgi:hypothetical protein